MKFAARGDAGHQLGQHLLDRAVQVDMAVGLPRGGVVVAAEVARVLQCPLEVLIVRKIGHPWHREFAVGALAEQDVVLLNEHIIPSDFSAGERLRAIIREENERLHAYEQRFHPDGRSNFIGKAVLLVDDGLATGATAEAAVLSARKQGARSVMVATPVASAEAVVRLRLVADQVTALIIDPQFEAVGSYYESFAQTTDEEVLALLAQHVW